MGELLVTSAAVPMRYASSRNHLTYCQARGYAYRHISSAPDGLQTPHFLKLHVIAAALEEGRPWVLWLDDDAFFTDMSFDAAAIARAAAQDVDLITGLAPLRPDGTSTWLNSGVMWVRNSDRGRRIIHEAFRTPRAEVRAAWSKSFGNRTAGEQDHLIYILHRDGLTEHVQRLPWAACNARPYHWQEGDPLRRYPICHFAGRDKETAMAAFRERYDLDDALLPAVES